MLIVEILHASMRHGVFSPSVYDRIKYEIRYSWYSIRNSMISRCSPTRINWKQIQQKIF